MGSSKIFWAWSPSKPWSSTGNMTSATFIGFMLTVPCLGRVGVPWSRHSDVSDIHGEPQGPASHGDASGLSLVVRTITLCFWCDVYCLCYAGDVGSSRFVKQECWRAKQKFVSGSKHRGRLAVLDMGAGGGPPSRCGGRMYHPRKMLTVYVQNQAIWCIFGQKMVHNSVQNAF